MFTAYCSAPKWPTNQSAQVYLLSTDWGWKLWLWDHFFQSTTKYISVSAFIRPSVTLQGMIFFLVWWHHNYTHAFCPLLQVCDSLCGLPSLLCPSWVPLRRLRCPKFPHRRDRLLHLGDSGLRGWSGPVPSQAGPGCGGLHGHRLWPPQSRSGLRGLHHLWSSGQPERVLSLRRHHLLRRRLCLLLHSDRSGGCNDRVWTDQGYALHVLRPLRGGMHPPGGSALSERIGSVAGVLLWHKIWLSLEAVVLPSRKLSMGQQGRGGGVLPCQLRPVLGWPDLFPEDTIFLTSAHKLESVAPSGSLFCITGLTGLSYVSASLFLFLICVSILYLKTHKILRGHWCCCWGSQTPQTTRESAVECEQGIFLPPWALCHTPLRWHPISLTRPSCPLRDLGKEPASPKQPGPTGMSCQILINPDTHAPHDLRHNTTPSYTHTLTSCLYFCSNNT